MRHNSTKMVAGKQLEVSIPGMTREMESSVLFDPSASPSCKVPSAFSSLLLGVAVTVNHDPMRPRDLSCVLVRGLLLVADNS
jgi:hypothetical protein